MQQPAWALQELGEGEKSGFPEERVQLARITSAPAPLS